MERLQNLVSTLETQHRQKADYVVGYDNIIMHEGKLIFPSEVDSYTPNAVCHEGLAEKLEIPGQYYNRMKAQRPELLDLTVGHWLKHSAGKKALIRTYETLEGNVARAFLSNSYRAIDNYDVLFAALDAIKKTGVEVEITDAQVTERKLYMTVICRQVEVDATSLLQGYLDRGDRAHVGNGVISGLIISNSEVGDGQFQIRPRAVVLKCNNGLIAPDDSFSRIHLGARLEAGAVVWSEATKNKNYELIMSQVTGAVTTFLSKEYLGRMLENVYKGQAQTLNRPVDTIQNVCKYLRYTQEQRESILNYFLHDGELSGAGITHAITRHAQAEGADKRYEMELAAFNLLGRMKQFDKPFSGN